MISVGKRIGAILSVEKGIIRLLGFGTYEGNFPYPGMPTLEECFPDMAAVTDADEREMRIAMYERLSQNPLLKLDNGDQVWGRECWWGDEDVVRERIADAPIIHVRFIRDDFDRVVDMIELS